MRPVVVSRLTRADLREIGDFIAPGNPGRAASFVVALRARCERLGQRPMMGRPAPEVGPEVRILVFRSDLIPHRALDKRILIDRVVHSARDRSDLSPHE